MEPAQDGPFASRERVSAEHFAVAAADAGVTRIVYLGGMVCRGRPAVGPPRQPSGGRGRAGRGTGLRRLRASIVIEDPVALVSLSGCRLVERPSGPPLSGLAKQPHRSRRRARHRRGPRSLRHLAQGSERRLDVAGSDVVSYGELIEHVANHVYVSQPGLGSSGCRRRRSPAAWPPWSPASSGSSWVH